LVGDGLGSLAATPDLILCIGDFLFDIPDFACESGEFIGQVTVLALVLIDLAPGLIDLSLIL